MLRSTVATFLLLLTCALASLSAEPRAARKRVTERHATKCAKEAVNDILRTGICHIHHIRLRETSVPIDIEFEPGCDDPYYNIEVCYFPHARLFARNNSDVIEWPPPKEDKVFVCPLCRRAQKEWAIAHAKTKWGHYILSHQNI